MLWHTKKDKFRIFMNNKEKTVVCILGMHRSGTSMVTRLLNICGLELGNKDFLFNMKNESNQKGHWENKEILRINQEVLSIFGGSWDKPPIFPDAWESDNRLKLLYEEAQKFVDNMNAMYDMWGFKEPRTCLTLPFWQKIIPRMKYIIVIRHPADVARSLRKRNDMFIYDGVLLWMTYMLSILRYVNMDNAMLTFYDNYFVQAKKEIRKMIGFIGNGNLGIRNNDTEINDFISHDLRHHNHSIRNFDENSIIDYEMMVEWAVESFVEKGAERHHKFFQNEQEVLELKKIVLKKERDIINLYQSIQYLIGDLFYKSIKKPYKLVTLPINLIRILIEKK